jgi:hypothetical protein
LRSPTSPVASDPALDAELLDVGTTIEDARAPEPARLGGRELPFGADLVHALLRDSEDRGGRGLADQVAMHDRRLTIRRRGVCLSFTETLLGADHVGVARVERQRVATCRLSFHDLLDLELPHPAITFRQRFRRAPSG